MGVPLGAKKFWKVTKHDKRQETVRKIPSDVNSNSLFSWKNMHSKFWELKYCPSYMDVQFTVSQLLVVDCSRLWENCVLFIVILKLASFWYFYQRRWEVDNVILKPSTASFSATELFIVIYKKQLEEPILSLQSFKEWKSTGIARVDCRTYKKRSIGQQLW